MTGLLALNVVILIYFAVLNILYLVLIIVAFRRMHTYVRRLRPVHIEDLVSASEGLSMSLLVPAYNEAEMIIDSVRSLLTLRYPDYEIIIINDGSTDATLVRLISAFELRCIERVATSSVATQPVGQVYQSRRHPNLYVVDKENGGKADALNAGLNYSRGAIISALDADTLLEPDALARLVRPFLEDSTTVAVGGIIRIVNGCRVENGYVTDIRLPKKILPRFQVLEYLRAFLTFRVGWESLSATLIISGAFGAFRRSTVEEVGGFDPRTIAEDMEMVIRLHRHCRDNDIPYRITFIADPVAWTDAPETVAQLAGQRNRWQRGLAQVLVIHRGMIGRSRYGVPGVVAMPYYFVFELFGPVVELIGWIAIIFAVAFGAVPPAFIVSFFVLAVLLGSVYSVAAVALEELSFRRYRRFSDLLRVLSLALIESFGYRQLTTFWRLRGLVSAMRGDTSWGEMERTGFNNAASRAQARVS